MEPLERQKKINSNAPGPDFDDDDLGSMLNNFERLGESLAFFTKMTTQKKQ